MEAQNAHAHSRRLFRATVACWIAVALWLIAGTGVIALASAGQPPFPPAVTVVIFAALGAVVVCLLVMRSHIGMAGRVAAVAEDLAQLRVEFDHLVALYADLVRGLDQMRAWMMRPAVPRGVVARGSAAVVVPAADPIEDNTVSLRSVSDGADPTLRARAEVIELGERIARRVVEPSPEPPAG
jgi:hypothetical protein